MTSFPWFQSLRYCYSCGENLMERHFIYAYDEETGKPKMGSEYKCRNQPWIWSEERHPCTESDAYVFQG